MRNFCVGVDLWALVVCSLWFGVWIRVWFTVWVWVSVWISVWVWVWVCVWVACVNWRQLNVKQHVNDFCGRSPSECVISRALKLDYSIRSAAFKCNQCKPNEFIITQPEKKISAQRESFSIEKPLINFQEVNFKVLKLKWKIFNKNLRGLKKT